MGNIISDIATCIKAGFTINDIKEVIKASNETVVSPAPESVPPAPAPAPAPAPEADNTDYKALYEQSQKDLKELQKANTKDDISPEPLQIDEIIKSVKSRIC